MTSSVFSFLRGAIPWLRQRSSADAYFNRIFPEGTTFGAERLRQPYRYSTWVNRAIKKIAGPISNVSLQFARAQADGTVETVADPQLAAYWQQPCPGCTFPDFVEASVGWLKLAGEFFWLLPDTALVPFPEAHSPAGAPAHPLLIARPDRMRHITDNQNQLIGWEFTDGARLKHHLLPDQVIHVKLWNPYDDHRGLSEMDAAQDAAEADYLAGKYNLNLMRNNGDQGPYIVAKAGMVDDAQRKQIVESLREKKELSLRGIFKPMFLTGDITVEDPKVQALDAAVLQGRIQNRYEIFLAFGVPPSMADKMVSYSVGSASDWYMLIFETCIPTGNKLAASITRVNRQLFGRELQASFSWKDHPVMQQVRQERLDSALKLWGVGMPMERASQFLQLDLPKFDGWEIGYLPFSVAPVGTEPPEADAALGEPAADDAEEDQDLDKLFECEHRRQDPPVERMLRALRTPPSARRTPQELATWRTHMSKRRGTAKAYASAFRRHLMLARAEVLRKLERNKKLTTEERARGAKAAVMDFMFDLSKFERGLLGSMRNVARGALQTAGEQLFTEIRRDDPFVYPPAQALEFIRERDNKITGAAQNVFDQIKGTLEEGLNQGDTMDELAGRIRTEFNGISRERAQTIAITETAAAYGTARQTAMEAAGITLKRWLTSGNDNVRPAHRQANGQTVGITEPFDVGGEQLMHPGDPNGSPGNVINCHCVSIAVAAEEETQPEEIT